MPEGSGTFTPFPSDPIEHLLGLMMNAPQFNKIPLLGESTVGMGSPPALGVPVVGCAKTCLGGEGRTASCSMDGAFPAVDLGLSLPQGAQPQQT